MKFNESFTEFAVNTEDIEQYFISEEHRLAYKEELLRRKTGPYYYSKNALIFLLTINEKYREILNIYYDNYSNKFIVPDDVAEEKDKIYLRIVNKIFNLKESPIIRNEELIKEYEEKGLAYTTESKAISNEIEVKLLIDKINKNKNLLKAQKQALINGIEVYLYFLKNMDKKFTKRKQTSNLHIILTDDEQKKLERILKDNNIKNKSNYVKSKILDEARVGITSDHIEILDRFLNELGVVKELRVDIRNYIDGSGDISLEDVEKELITIEKECKKILEKIK